MDRATLPPVPAVISISGLTKTYASGLQALKSVDLEIRKGEIFALLGPNGAGKTTLISIVCGIVTPTAGRVLVDGHDIVRDYRAARSKIGLVPQELHTDMFEIGVGARSASAAACSGARRTRRTSSRCCATSRCGTSATTRS